MAADGEIGQRRHGGWFDGLPHLIPRIRLGEAQQQTALTPPRRNRPPQQPQRDWQRNGGQIPEELPDKCNHQQLEKAQIAGLETHCLVIHRRFSIVFPLARWREEVSARRCTLYASRVTPTIITMA